MMDFFKTAIQTVAQITTPLALSGFIATLFFFVVYTLVKKAEMRGIQYYRLLKYVFFYCFIISLTTITLSLSAWALNKYWVKPGEVAQCIIEIRKAMIEWNDLNRTTKYVNKCLKKSPDHPQLVFLLGVVQYKNNRFKVALVQFRNAYKLGRGPKTLYSVAAALARLRRFNEAIKEMKQLILETNPGLSDELFLGKLYVLDGKISMARNILNKLYNMKNSKPRFASRVAFNLGLSYVKEGNTNYNVIKAIKYFWRSICLEKKMENVYLYYRNNIPNENKSNFTVELDILKTIRYHPEYQKFRKQWVSIQRLEKCSKALG